MSTHTAFATTRPGVLEKIQVPTPAPGPNEVLVKMRYVGLAPIDSYRLDTGIFVQQDQYPYVLGAAGSGEIVSVGHDVTDLRRGDSVSR